MIGSEAKETQHKQGRRQRDGSQRLLAALVHNHGAEPWKASQTTGIDESSPCGAKASTPTIFPYGLVCMSPK